MTIVALDAMGGDHAPKVTVQGALIAARDPGLELILVGRGAELRGLIPAAPPNLRIEEASQAVGMGDAPVASIRQKPDSSIMVGLELLKRGRADAFVSFGNTGAVMAASLVKLGRVPGVDRPALGAPFRNGRGSRTLLLDVGANVDCRPRLPAAVRDHGQGLPGARAASSQSQRRPAQRGRGAGQGQPSSSRTPTTCWSATSPTSSATSRATRCSPARPTSSSPTASTATSR